MAEPHRKPTKKKPKQKKDTDNAQPFVSTRILLTIIFAAIVLFAGCWWGGQNEGQNPDVEIATATPQRPQSSAAITRIASTLAESEATQVAETSTPVSADSALVVLPTVTPTVVPSPVATRTVELDGNATLRLQLDSDNFESSGQPVIIAIDPHGYVLGGDTLSQSDEWCMQIGPTGLIFDLTYSLNPINEDLMVDGELRLHDGFCGQWGSLGNILSAQTLHIVVPAGSTAQIAPAMQVQGSFMGLPDVIDISTGVYLDLNFRNPRP